MSVLLLIFLVLENFKIFELQTLASNARSQKIGSNGSPDIGDDSNLSKGLAQEWA